MEKDENKTGIELKKLLTLNSGGDDYKRALPVDEDEDFFPELTKEFDNLKKELESSTSGYENRFVSSATTFLENLARTALNEIVERVESTYNEWLEVKNTLGKVIYTFYKRGLKNVPDAKNFNKESAIALQSVIPQLRKIAQVYQIPLKNENAKTKMTKGSSLLWKIERIQDIIYRFNSAVNAEKYMNYESCLLGAYILAKRIEEEDALFNIWGLSVEIEGVCELLDGKSEEFISQISHDQIESALKLFFPISLYKFDCFYRQINEIYAILDREARSIFRVTMLFIMHIKSSHLSKSQGLLNINTAENILRLLKQLINKQEETQQTAEDTNKTLHDVTDKRYKGIKAQAAVLDIGETSMKELRKEHPELKMGATKLELKTALANYETKLRTKHKAKK